MTTNDQDFQFEEATITTIHQAFSQNTLTCTQLVDYYLNRIETLNPILRAVVEVNPDARALAKLADDERDNARGNGAELGALHGVPVLVKDTIGTKDKMGTTAGSYALVGSVVARDATVVEKLRKSGAILLGKASLSEWYKIRSIDHLPNGWCARAGQGVNPYVKSADPCGSSSGSAISVAANLVAVSLGTDTHSSIICPSDHNSAVGLRPTVGLVSRAGVIPISSRQDTVGPICRTVSDCVYVLDAIAGPDPRDEEATTKSSKYIPRGGYKQFLKVDGVRGKRLGIVRHPFVTSLHESTVAQSFEHHLETLRERGATLVDSLEISHIAEILNPHDSGEITAMIADFKHAISKYLNELESSPVRSLAEIIAFNEKNPELEKTNEFGQDGFVEAENMHGNGEEIAKIIEHLEQLCKEGFEKLMKENELDAMVTPGTKAIPVMAIGGYPGITIPAGYDEHGIPFGMLFSGLKGTEPKLIEIGYAFEQATLARKPPLFDSPEWHEDLHIP
ncbi:probable amidase At4g34880 [Beta vulgaris subsp. vulgaris]|uniref:probable amidase At4g34880 n=1 Tax=Beta vulgaris subsp. vulgaris TaxID=3555 RepID=UPI0020370F56|nr:probable amidase At4g34880 [Beta vulgaris subsp. vulgaris]